MATKYDRMMTYLKWLLPVKLPEPLVSWSCKITWQTKTIISLLPQCPQPQNLGGWLVTYHELLPPMKSHNHLITWSCKMTWQSKTVLSTLPQCLWPLSLEAWWLTMAGFHPQNYATLWSRDLVKSRWQGILCISTNTMPIDTKLGRLVGCWLTVRGSHLKPHDLLITLPTWGQMSSLKVYISTFTDLWPRNLAGC